MEYRKYKLEEIMNGFKYGTMPKKDRIKNINNGKYPIYTGYLISGYYDEYNIEKETLIVVARGVGGTGDVKITPNKCFLTNLSIAMFNNEKIAINKYLYYYFKIHNLRYLDSGSAQSQITINDLKNVKIPIPDIEKQYKIVKILSSIDKKIELNNQINDNLQKLINNLYIKYFINFDSCCEDYKSSVLGMIPENFKVDTLGNIISFSNGYGWDSKDMSDNYINNSYKVFKMGNINIGGGINKSKTKSWILKNKVKNLEQYISRKGDILMCMTDMKNSGNPLLGHTALIDRDNEFVINQRVGILRCDKEIGYSYIYTMSNMPEFINEIRSKANSGVQVNLTTKGICDTLVLVPDNYTLKKFESIAIPLYEQIFSNNNENEKLANLRNTLLPKLMNGEIDLDKVEI